MDFTIDAKNKYLGRLASQISLILQGKHHPNYDPRLAGNDRVIIQNIKSLKVSGQKKEKKIYYHHTGYIGNLKAVTYRQLIAKDSNAALRHAVRGMLPKNRLQIKRLKRLIIL